jgi:hypothetical protein
MEAWHTEWAPDALTCVACPVHAECYSIPVGDTAWSVFPKDLRLSQPWRACNFGLGLEV